MADVLILRGERGGVADELILRGESGGVIATLWVRELDDKGGWGAETEVKTEAARGERGGIKDRLFRRRGLRGVGTALERETRGETGG